MEFEVSIFGSSHCDREYVEYMQMEEEEEEEDMKEVDNKEEDEDEEDEVDVEEDKDKNKKDEDEDEEDEEGEEEDMVDEDEEEDDDEDEDYNVEDEDEYEDGNEEDTDEEGEEAATHDKHFECTIRQYCLSKGFMWIPKHFALANGLINGNKKCGLIIIDERQTRSWNLMLTSSKTGVCIHGDGWRKFSTDNCLKEGDHIMFETVTNGETPIWKFRVVWDNVETPTMKFQADKLKAKIKTSGKDFSNVKAAKDMHLSDHSHFICTVRSYSLSKHYLCVPKQFAQENRLNNRKCKIIMRDEQQSWTFNVYSSGHSTYFGSEWREFCSTNCLKEGDRVMFEIVSKGETPIFRFHDLREKKKKPNAERMSSDKDLKRKNLETLGATTLKSQLASSTSADANSHFTSTIKPYSISHPVLHLPMNFVKSNGLMRRREMILVDGKQRSWSVCVGRKGGDHFAIKRGWTQFRNANGVQVGDTYKFELINNGRIPVVHFHCR